jgi:DinB superfamily
MHYATLSLADVRGGLDSIARETQATFGRFDAQQLNWRPDAPRWSVEQCYDHLLTAHRLMFQATEVALTDAAPRPLWQRLPVLPRVFGRILVCSQAPSSARKFTAPSKAHSATNDIGADIIQRFVEQHRNAVAVAQALDERDAAGAIMTSPFIRFVTYSVLDGWRAHIRARSAAHRQARGVTLS